MLAIDREQPRSHLRTAAARLEENGGDLAKIGANARSDGGRLLLARVMSAAVAGVEAYTVEVDVDLSTGQTYFAMVGLPDAAVQEARERVNSAVRNSGRRDDAR